MDQQHSSLSGAVPAVVVGVDGNPAGDAALAYAVHEAAALHAPLRVVHAFDVLRSGPAVPRPRFASPEMLRRETLGAGMERARRLADGRVPVTGRLQRGPVARCLVEDSLGAELVVVGRHEHNGLGSVMSRSLSARVAARAHCPVAVVPTGWERPAAADRVTVGVDVPFRSHAILREGLRLAAAADLRLRVLHLWRPSATSEPTMSDAARAWLSRTETDRRRELETATAGEAERVASVPVDVDVESVPPSDALVAASRESAVLVMGRRDRLLGLGPRMGSVAGHLLRTSACPVVFVPPAPPRALHATTSNEDRHLEVAP